MANNAVTRNERIIWMSIEHELREFCRRATATPTTGGHHCRLVGRHQCRGAPFKASDNLMALLSCKTRFIPDGFVAPDRARSKNGELISSVRAVRVRREPQEINNL